MSLNDHRESEPKVSVIIPVYNPGVGIRRCIESLRKQELREIEMIFIDDCGEDDSMEAVESAAMEDARIRILRNPRNLGPGPSRNVGIETAKGEYLSFVDPDDFVDSKFLLLLYMKAKAKECDIAKGTCIFCKEESDGTLHEKIRNELNENILESEEKGTPLFRVFTYHHWTAIYRRDIVLKHARYGMSRVGQDVTFLLKICMFCRNICIEENAIYYYVRRQNSAVNQITNDKLIEYVKALRERCDYLESCKSVDRIELARYVQAQSMYLMKYYLYWSYHPENRMTCIQCVEEIRSIIIGLSFAWEVIYLSEKIRILIMYHENTMLDVLALQGEVLDPKEWINNYSNGVRAIQNHPGIYSRTMKGHIESAYKSSYRVIMELMILKGEMSESAHYINILKKEKEKLEQIIKKEEGVSVSVIVPFFNPEKERFKKCVESLVNQKLKNIELIFIDDYGSDDSVKYINRLAETNNRMVVIRNPLNLGPGISKNIGIENAKGKYLIFVEANDYLDSDYIYRLFEKAELTDADIIISSVIIENSKERFPINRGKIIENANGIISYANLRYACSGNLFRKEYLDERRISFDKTYYEEDRLFLFGAMLNNPVISFVSDAYYHLQKHSRAYTDKYLKQIVLSLNDRVNYIEKHHDEYENAIIQLYLWRMIFDYLEIQVIINKMNFSSNIKDKYFADVKKQLKRITSWGEYGVSNYVTDSLIHNDCNLVVSKFQGETGFVRMDAFLQVCENYKEAIYVCPEIVDADFLSGFKYAYRNSCQYISTMIRNKDEEINIRLFYRTLYDCYKKSADGLNKLGVLI